MTTIPTSVASSTTASLTWFEAVQRASAIAQAKMPAEMHGRIQRGTALVLDGHVWLEEDGHTCQVYSTQEARYYSANGHCECQDTLPALGRLCKHRAARALYIRAQELLATGLRLPDVPLEAPISLENPVAPVDVPGIDPRDLVTISGKPFIKFAGLLTMAHAAGLVELHAEFTYNDATLAIAYAVAIFADGRRFAESGDASPENAARVGLAWRRMALVRAKARALRDALAIEIAAAEEME